MRALESTCFFIWEIVHDVTLLVLVCHVLQCKYYNSIASPLVRMARSFTVQPHSATCLNEASQPLYCSVLWTEWAQKARYFIKTLQEHTSLISFVSASSLCLWQGHSAHYSVIEQTLVDVTTDRSALQAGERESESKSERERDIWLLLVLAFVMWHHVPLYCDVVIGGEEMKCLEATREVYLCGWTMEDSEV